MNWWMMSADESCVVNMRKANALRIEEHLYDSWTLQVDVLDNSYTLGEYKTFREAHEEMMRIVREMNSKEREET